MLADHAEVTRETASSIETGRSRDPGLCALEKIAVALGIPLKDLFDR